MQNSSVDFASLLRFLGEEEATEDFADLKRSCARVDAGDKFEMKRLQERLRPLVLRRNKVREQ
jgi:hypothetical protein